MILKTRFFLASSDELSAERDLVELLIHRKNSTLIDKGLFLEVVRWEEMLHDFDPIRVQNRFSEEILCCDAMIVLFHTKVGRFTKKEFDKGYRSFKAGMNPRHIWVYFKNTQIKVDKDIIQIVRMKDRIKRDQQLFVEFETRAELELSFRKQLELVSLSYERQAGYFSPPAPVIDSEAAGIPTDPSVALRVLEKDEVRSLAEAIGMFRNWSTNPHLKFEEGDVLYFWERRYPRARLEAQFRARRLVLEIADKNRFFMPEPGDLSEKAKPIEGRILTAWQNRSTENQ